MRLKNLPGSLSRRWVSCVIIRKTEQKKIIKITEKKYKSTKPKNIFSWLQRKIRKKEKKNWKLKKIYKKKRGNFVGGVWGNKRRRSRAIKREIAKKKEGGTLMILRGRLLFAIFLGRLQSTLTQTNEGFCTERKERERGLSPLTKKVYIKGPHWRNCSRF